MQDIIAHWLGTSENGFILINVSVIRACRRMDVVAEWAERLPGWILAVLPIFRFSGIPLLIESR